MSEPTDTERARALLDRRAEERTMPDPSEQDRARAVVLLDSLTNWGGFVRDEGRADAERIAAALAAVRAEGERAGLIRLRVYVATAIQNCEREKPGKTTDAAQAHYGGRLAAYRNVMRWLAEAIERKAGKERP